jgi:hypothetical protein
VSRRARAREKIRFLNTFLPKFYFSLLQVNSSPTCADMSGRSAGGGGPLVHFGNGGPPNHRSLPPCGGGAGRSPLVQSNSLGRSLPQPPPPPPPPAPGGGHHQLNLKLGGALGGLTGLFTRLDRTARKIPIYVFHFWELRGLSPNFLIYVSVSDLYIQRIGPHIFLQHNRQTDHGNTYINHSQTHECGNWN